MSQYNRSDNISRPNTSGGSSQPLSNDLARANSNQNNFQQPNYNNQQFVSRSQTNSQVEDNQIATNSFSRQNDRSGQNDPRFNKTANQAHFSNPFESLIDEIRSKQVLTLNQFFQPFDPYKNRIFQLWELQLIFPRVQLNILKEICEINQHQDALRNGEIKLEFLINKLYDTQGINSINIYSRPSLPEESMYVKKSVSNNIQNALIKLAEQRDVSYDPSVGFDKLFNGGNSNSHQINVNQIDSALRQHCALNMEKSDVIELLIYFSHNSQDTSSLNRINFIQGIKPWVEKKRPINEINNLNQQQFGQTQNFQNQPFQQQQYYNTTQPTNQFQPNQYSTIQQQQPDHTLPTQQYYQQQTSQQTQNYAIQQPMTQQNYTRPQQLYGQPNTFEQTGRLNQNQDYQNLQTQSLNPQAQILNNEPKLSQEEQIFRQVSNQFGNDLDQIVNALKQRKTGIFKHLSQHSRDGVNQNQEEFSRSLDVLGLNQIHSNSRYQIFQSLAVLHNGSYQIPINTFESLFKTHSNTKAPRVNKDAVLQNIIQAFNLDVLFIQNNLGRKGQSYESFIEFFEQFPNHQQFYNLDQIQAVADAYLFHNGLVNQQKFVADLQQIISGGNLQRKSGFDGIHHDNRGDTQAQSNPLMPNTSTDQTQTSLIGRVEKPFYFVPPQDDIAVEELIKGCYVINKLIEEYFVSYQRNGVMIKQDFTSAVSALRSSLQISQAERLFDEIDKVMTNNRPFGQITAQQVDQYIHFACKSSINKLYDTILARIVERVSLRNVNLLSQFQMLDSRGTNIISISQFTQVLNDVDASLRDNDLPFITKKYVNSGNVMYLKFMDDFNQALRLNQSENKRALPEYIAEQIKKKLYILKVDLLSYVKRHIKAQFASQNDFTDVFGQQLELVPQVCQHSALVQIFNQLARNGSVSVDEIVRYFEMKCARDHHFLKDEILKQLRQHSASVRQAFEKERDVINHGSLSLSIFEAILLRDFKFSALDANFIADFYLKGGSVDVQTFLTDVSGDQQNQNNNIKLNELLQVLKNAADNRRVELALEFGRHQVGRGSTIPKQAFFSEINRFYKLNHQEEAILEQNFTSQHNPREVDHIEFLERIRAVQMDIRGKKVAYTQEQSQVLQEAKRILSNEKDVSRILVRGLSFQDSQNKGYLSQQKMLLALREAANVRSKQGVVIFYLNESQANTLISCCETDSNGDFNYRQLLDQTVGKAQVEQFLSLENKQQQIEAPKNVVGQASSQSLAKFSQKIFPKQKTIEEQIVKTARQKIQGVPLINEQDFISIIVQCGINLSVDERLDLQNLLQKTRDSQGLNNSVQIFKELGLSPIIISQTGSKAPPKPKLLSEQDLRACQDLIIEVRKDIKQQGRKPEQMVQNVVGSSIGPADFMKTLKAETSETVRVKLTNQSVGNLMHYLYKDEPGRVSVKKLMQALQLPENQPPLKQDGVDEQQQYLQNLDRKLNNTPVPFPIYELNQFMRSKNNMSLGQLLQIQQNQINSDMLVTTFEQKLLEQEYLPKERNELIKALQTQQTGTNKVSIGLLQKFLKELAFKVTDQRQVKEKYGRMNNVVRNNISQISQYMQRNDITIEVLHKQLDVNGDGSVDKQEFVEGVYSLMKPCPLTKKDLGEIFDQIDINGDHYLSVNEFALFLDGAKLTNQQKIDRMDPRLIEEITNKIGDLFRQFDIKQLGYITYLEILNTMKGLRHPISEEKAKEMIKKVDLDGDGRISLQELVLLLRPILVEELVSKENQIEEIRALFKEADTDYSGFLTIDEMYYCMLKMGANVTRQELVALFMEFDINGDMQIDIDEFVQIMSFGDEIQLNQQENVATYMKIKQARKLNVLDFAKIFNNLPQSFVPSFFTERYQGLRKNLPSSGLKAQIDTKTMSWKDMLPLLSEHMTTEYQKQGIKFMRPIPTSLGCQIIIDSAEGVPLPAENKDFDRNNIVKRELRVGTYDTTKQELIFNSAHVVAKWDSSQEDIWTFDAPEIASSLNPILFRTTQIDDLDKQKNVIVFELVLYLKNGKQTTEMSCGWAQLELSQCEKDLTKLKLEIKGGSPMNQIKIEDADIHTKRSGVKGLFKMFNSNIKSTLIVSIQPLNKIDDATRTHMEFLPSTCVVHKKLVSFVSGYRNYAAEVLIRGGIAGSMKKPIGDVILSTFPKIINCPDVVELLVLCWTEDFIEKRNATERRSIELAVTKVRDYIQRLYPVFFADEFGYQISNITESACGDAPKLAARQALITSALRYNNKDAKKAASKPPQTSYKPFNIRETEFEIWEDGHAQNQESFMRKFDQAGIIAAPGI